VILLPLQSARAENTSSKGVGTAEFSGWRGPSEKVRRQALVSAKFNAIERYISQGNQSQLKGFEKIRDQVRQQIDDFVLSASIISEDVDKKAKRYTIVVRADLNVNRLRYALQANSAVTNTASNERPTIAMVFVAREVRSVKSFKDKEYSRQDVEKSKEGSAAHAGSPATLDYAATSSQSVRTTRGGSITRKAEKIEYDVSDAGDVNSAMLKVFSTAGYEVVEGKYAEDYSNGLLSVEAFREDYRHGDDLSGKTLRNAVLGVKSIGIPMLAIGKLDVGMKDEDPISGLTRVYVRVNGKVLDVSGRFPKTIASVGPVQYAGIGPNQIVARENALKLAAESAANELTDQLNAKGVK